MHQRLTPKEHAFSYPLSFFGLLIDELPRLSKQATFFGYNECSVLRLNDADYLSPGNASIAAKLEALLGPPAPNEQTLLITSPRYFGYAFNPVNFYLRLRGQAIIAAVAEVNNTFGDRHVYSLRKLEAGSDIYTWTARCPKDFHVSPFNDISGDYAFTLRLESGRIHLGVDLYREGRCVMKTWIRGTGKNLSNRNILRYVLLHPFDTALNSMPRILWQAAILYLKKRMPVYKRPFPTSPDTLINRDSSGNNRVI